MVIRVLLDDDHSVVREGSRMFLGRDPELVVVGEAADGAEAIQLASAYLLRSVRSPETHQVLTDREMEVLCLLAKGESNKEIAHHLQVVEDTVKTHVRHILEKFGVQSRTQAVLSAVRLGLISLDKKSIEATSYETG